MNVLCNCWGCKTSTQISWQERQMSNPVRKFQPERFQEILRAGWNMMYSSSNQNPRFLSTNLKFMPDGRMIITPFEDSTTWSIDCWAIGIEVSIIDDDGDRKEPEPMLLCHAFSSCQITTQYKSLLPHPIPLVPTSRRAHKWWIDGMDGIWREMYYISVRLIIVEVPGSHGHCLDDFLAVFYTSDGNTPCAVGQIAIDYTDYAWPHRCVYLPDSGLLRERTTQHTLMIPPTCRLFDIHRDARGGYMTFEALTEPMDFWNVMVLRRVGLPLSEARGLMWMNGCGALAACASATAGFKEELFARTWAPGRHVEWCLDVEEQAEMLAGGDTFADWREAAEAAEKKIQDMVE